MPGRSCLQRVAGVTGDCQFRQRDIKRVWKRFSENRFSREKRASEQALTFLQIYSDSKFVLAQRGA